MCARGAGVVPVRHGDAAEAWMREGGHVPACPHPVGTGHRQALVGVHRAVAAKRRGQGGRDSSGHQYDVGGQVTVGRRAHDAAGSGAVDAGERASAEELHAEPGEHALGRAAHGRMLPVQRVLGPLHERDAVAARERRCGLAPDQARADHDDAASRGREPRQDGLDRRRIDVLIGRLDAGHRRSRDAKAGGPYELLEADRPHRAVVANADEDQTPAEVEVERPAVDVVDPGGGEPGGVREIRHRTAIEGALGERWPIAGKAGADEGDRHVLGRQATRAGVSGDTVADDRDRARARHRSLLPGSATGIGRDSGRSIHRYHAAPATTAAEQA